MTMKNVKKVIGKEDRGFELIMKAHNMDLHLKGETLRDDTTVSILKTINYERMLLRRVPSGDLLPREAESRKRFHPRHIYHQRRWRRTPQ